MIDVILALARADEAAPLAHALTAAGFQVQSLEGGRPSPAMLISARVVAAEVEEGRYDETHALLAAVPPEQKPRVLAVGPVAPLPIDAAREWVDSRLGLEAQAAIIASAVGEARAEAGGRDRLEALREEIDRSRALQGVLSRMSSTLVLSEALQVFVEGVHGALDLAAVAAVLTHSDSDCLKVVAEAPYGAGARGLLEKPLDSLGRSMQSGLGPPAFLCLWPGDGVASVPIVVEGRSVGAVLLVVRRGEEDDARISSTVETSVNAIADLTAHVGHAVRNARLYNDVQVRSAQMAALYAVGRTITGMHEIAALLAAIVESAATVTGASRCSLMLLDDEERVLRIRAAKGVPEWICNSAVAKLGEGVSGYVAELGEPLLIEDIRRDPRFDPRVDSRCYANNSLLSVPVLVRGEARGVINLNDKEGGRAFTRTDLELAVLLASQAAVAIDNAYLYEQLRLLAATDSLTRLYNHRHYMVRLESAIKQARRHHRPLSVLMMDLDHFKRINDTYGHQQGDKVLQAFAAVLQRTAREEDTLARYGGEEFAAVLPDTSVHGAVRLAERIRERLSALEFEHPAGSFRVSVSIGAAELSDAIRSAEDFSSLADLALYEAKALGRDRVAIREAASRDARDA